MTIFKVWPTVEDGRPQLVLDHFDSDWDEALATGTVPTLSTTSPSEPLDYYPLAGTLGVASERLADTIKTMARGRIRLCPIRVDGQRFFVLLAGDALDVLDKERSDFTVFRSNPNKVKQVLHFEFHLDAIGEAPCVFSIPESPVLLLANATAVERLRTQAFTGILPVAL